MPPAATGILRRWSADGNETNRERSTKLQNISLDKNRPESPLGPSFPIGGNTPRRGAEAADRSPINGPAAARERRSREPIKSGRTKEKAAL